MTVKKCLKCGESETFDSKSAPRTYVCNDCHLESCPFCGGKASLTVLTHRNGQATVNVSCGTADDCTDTCGCVLFGHAETVDQMINKWNKWNART